ncbi:Cilia- and flagella-associated protein 54 [Merluccius polli]|uniref:Cilia- and flagella-associated protein 54 n=1 Tax=Merluccius polli TaxID=89951 RepID=A0AA47MJZ3_MERPO|nr:Cilia- and flagella-associated protein 54 [Merluccius polli]
MAATLTYRSNGPKQSMWRLCMSMGLTPSREGTSGVKGRRDTEGEAWLECFSALTTEPSQLELAVSGESRVCLASAVRFIQLLFHYEQHSVFTPLARHMLQALESMEGPFFRKAESELSLLEALVCLQTAQKTRPKEEHTANDMFGAVLSEEFVGLLEVLHGCVCSSAQDVWPDRDLVLAAVLNLWAKLKAPFHNTELQPLDSKHYSDHHKLPWCLWTLCEVATACDLASTDCLATGEMSLRLALLLEHTAHHNTLRHTSAHSEEGAVDHSALSILKRPSGELFCMVCEVAERGLDALGRGWSSLQSQTGSIHQRSPSPGERQGAAKEEAQRRTPCPDRPSLASLTALDLNLELLNALHRASLKRLQLCPEGVSEADLLDRIKKNKVSKALFLTQKALMVHGDMEPNRSYKTKSLLEEATVLLEKAEAEERRLYKPRTAPPSTGREEDRGDGPPPAPLLLSRTNHSLTFVPAPYRTNQQVCWYRICGRAATTTNLRVRLGDCSLQGTGHLVPVVGGQCDLTVEGLEHNQKYVFALEAYDSQGALLGNAIGQTTRPVLASIPLPTLSAWALLAQVAFETEQFAVAKRACGELWSHFTQSDSNLSPAG